MSNLLQIGGAVLVTAGAALIALPLGLIIGGVFAILIGISMER
jgi:hypothetical protein